MKASQARAVAREWVEIEAGRLPGFRGALWHGSILSLPDDAELPPSSDIDIVVVVDDPAGQPSLGKIVRGDVLLDVSFVGWSDGAILGIDLAIRHPDRVNKVFAFAANTVTSGVKDGVDKNPTFAAYIERAGKEYAKLSPTPKEYEAFVGQISQMWATQPSWTDVQLKAIKTPVLVVDGSAVKDKLVEAPITLTAGLHAIRVRFVDETSYTHISVYWQPPGGGREIIPSEQLTPTLTGEPKMLPTATPGAALSSPRSRNMNFRTG